MTDWAFDFSRVTIKEYRSLFDKSQPQDEEDEIVARVAGITVDELQALPVPEYRRLMREFIKAATTPVEENPT